MNLSAGIKPHFDITNQIRDRRIHLQKRLICMNQVKVTGFEENLTVFAIVLGTKPYRVFVEEKR